MKEVEESPKEEKLGEEERELRTEEAEEEAEDAVDCLVRRFGCWEVVGGEVDSAPPYRDQSTWMVEFIARVARDLIAESIVCSS